MNFNTIFLKSFRVLLLPVALLYGWVIKLRNVLYDKEYFASSQFHFPVIAVGNLAVGGTGKSPMVEYLIELLHPSFRMAVLSRGYKRKTKGYVLAKADTTALEIGDEPMQFHIKFPEVAVAVCEERLVGIPYLLQDVLDLQVVVLDDAFQHREVVPGLNILLTEYANLYAKDYFLPTGDLRDERKSAHRAQLIVVTKCPENLGVEEKHRVIRQLQLLPHQRIFFTAIAYGTPYHIFNTSDEWHLTQRDEVLLVCGIANPAPLKAYLLDKVHSYSQLDYADHHIFSIDDLNDIQDQFDAIPGRDKMILTTEKDAVRLLKFQQQLQKVPLYVLPIQHYFLFGEGIFFNALVTDFVKGFQTKKIHEEAKEQA
jgi:tetraacyldisaccharide 4'-kinase